MNLSSVVITGPGKIRTQNQDNFYLDGLYRNDLNNNNILFNGSSTSDFGMYAVADGMGGEQHGELASLIAVESMASIERNQGIEGLSKYLIDRNEEICKLITSNGGARSGSTFVGLIAHDDRVDIINIGDSRAYLFREGSLSQISKDHTALRNMIELGIISAEAARRHPERHKLTQHLGIFPDELIIEPYITSGNALEKDVFLLCSDGLYDMINDTDICTYLSKTTGLEEKAKALFDAAMAAGGKDNITVVLVQVDEHKKERITPTLIESIQQTTEQGKRDVSSYIPVRGEMHTEISVNTRATVEILQNRNKKIFPIIAVGAIAFILIAGMVGLSRANKKSLSKKQSVTLSDKSIITSIFDQEESVIPQNENVVPSFVIQYDLFNYGYDLVEIGEPEQKIDPEQVYSSISYIPEMFYGKYKLIGGESAMKQYVQSVGNMEYEE